MLLRDVARALSAQVIGDDSLLIERIVHPADVRGATDLAVAMSDDSFAALGECRAHAVVISAASTPPSDQFRGIVVTDKVRQSMAILTRLFGAGPSRVPGVHPTAVIADDAVLEPGVSVGAFVVVGERATIGANGVVFPHVTIGADVTIGRDAVLHPGVRIGERVELGDRVIVHANAVIGSDGFSFLPGAGGSGSAAGPQRVHSLGRVMIGDDVEIGAGTTIDRATLAATRIGNGTKIDNLVQVGHNVTIGEHCLICGMVGISGSVRIGDRVQVGGGAGIADHVHIGSDVLIAAGSGVGSNVAPGLVVSGYPARKHDRTLEAHVYLGRQKALHTKVGDLQGRIEHLEKAGGDHKR